MTIIILLVAFSRCLRYDVFTTLQLFCLGSMLSYISYPSVHTCCECLQRTTHTHTHKHPPTHLHPNTHTPTHTFTTSLFSQTKLSAPAHIRNVCTLVYHMKTLSKIYLIFNPEFRTDKDKIFQARPWSACARSPPNTTTPWSVLTRRRLSPSETILFIHIYILIPKE